LTSNLEPRTSNLEPLLLPSNADIAAVFDEIADLLEIQDANPFRVRAYRNAARTLGGLAKDVSAMATEGKDLTRIPGIGHDLAEKIGEIVSTGRCRALEKLRKEVPPALAELLKVPGLGPKRVKSLHDSLKVQSLADLKKAARDGRIRALPGFAEKTESHILDVLAQRPVGEHRFKLAVAARHAGALVEHLQGARGIERMALAGSYRRARETVGDLDLLVTAADSAAIMQRFTGYGEVDEIVSSGATRSTVMLKCGLQVDLRVVPDECFGAALHYFTGSKAHNIEIRRLGQQRGLKINEYGVFKGNRRVAGATEESVFACVELPFIPPELRENRGEIAAARAGRLPALVERGQLRGDLFTRPGAGRRALAQFSDAVAAAGLRYAAVCPAVGTGGLATRQTLALFDAVDRVNGARPPARLLRAVEVAIDEDGGLDADDEILARAQFVAATVRTRLDLPRSRQTERIRRALGHPRVHVYTQPEVGEDGADFDVDLLEIVAAAAEHGRALGLSAHPGRADLLDIHLQLARDKGVPVALGSWAGNGDELDYLGFSIGQARRGWLEAGDVWNTLSEDALTRKAGVAG